MSGGHTSFHRVDTRSLLLCKREEALCTWPLRSISEHPRRAYGRRLHSLDPPLLARASAPGGDVAKYHLLRLWEGCDMFRGVVIIIWRPMARSPSPGFSPHLAKAHRPMLRNVKNTMNGKCIADSLVNAIDRLGRQGGGDDCDGRTRAHSWGRCAQGGTLQLQQGRPQNRVRALSSLKKVTLVVQKLPARARCARCSSISKTRASGRTSPISLAWRRALREFGLRGLSKAASSITVFA